MKYVALLRGINVGTSKRIPMDLLRNLFEDCGYTSVSTYLNSGNVLFDSEKTNRQALEAEIQARLKSTLEMTIPTVVIRLEDLKALASAIPPEWTNDEVCRTDVAFLLDPEETETFLTGMPVRREFMEIRSLPGAVFWNIDRDKVYKSRLNRLIGSPLYDRITIRNVNTVRALAGKA